jgi:hypothetical protein
VCRKRELRTNWLNDRHNTGLLTSLNTYQPVLSFTFIYLSTGAKLGTEDLPVTSMNTYSPRKHQPKVYSILLTCDKDVHKPRSDNMALLRHNFNLRNIRKKTSYIHVSFPGKGSTLRFSKRYKVTVK